MLTKKGKLDTSAAGVDPCVSSLSQEDGDVTSSPHSMSDSPNGGKKQGKWDLFDPAVDLVAIAGADK